MVEVKILQVSKNGGTWYFGGYGCDGEIAYAYTPLQAKTFPVGLQWYNEKELNKAEKYLEKNEFSYRVMILKYDIESHGEWN